jgi:hypothetical protein
MFALLNAANIHCLRHGDPSSRLLARGGLAAAIRATAATTTLRAAPGGGCIATAHTTALVFTCGDSQGLDGTSSVALALQQVSACYIHPWPSLMLQWCNCSYRAPGRLIRVAGHYQGYCRPSNNVFSARNPLTRSSGWCER